MIEACIKNILNWYSKNKRDLLWRCNHEPYYVWISEVMLQQTRIEACIDYFHRFIKTLPTIEDLAMIKEEDLLKLWHRKSVIGMS